MKKYLILYFSLFALWLSAGDVQNSALAVVLNNKLSYYPRAQRLAAITSNLHIAMSAKWVKEHPEAYKIHQKRWLEKNKEKIKQKYRQRAEDRKLLLLLGIADGISVASASVEIRQHEIVAARSQREQEYDKEWRKKNREKCRAYKEAWKQRQIQKKLQLQENENNGNA